MSAGDSLGSCRRRGENGHLPHPDGATCITNHGGQGVPGVYSEDQADLQPPPSNEAWLEGYRYALLHPDDPGVQADLARYQEEQRERLVDQLQVELAEAKADHQRCCQLVAELYEAGTGRLGVGPRSGVVEDVAAERRALQEKLAEALHDRDQALKARDYAADERNRLRDALDAASARLKACREDADHNAARAEKAEQALAHVNRERDTLNRYLRAAQGEAGKARGQAAECMREAAQLHRQLDSLGTNPDRLAELVGAGEAVELFGRVYVARELLHLGSPGPTAPSDGSADYSSPEGTLLEAGSYPAGELLEAQGGVFVPVPAGHMLSVTVTPYEAEAPDPPEVVAATCTCFVAPGRLHLLTCDLVQRGLV